MLEIQGKKNTAAGCKYFEHVPTSNLETNMDPWVLSFVPFWSCLCVIEKLRSVQIAVLIIVLSSKKKDAMIMKIAWKSCIQVSKASKCRWLYLQSLLNNFTYLMHKAFTEFEKSNTFYVQISACRIFCPLLTTIWIKFNHRGICWTW